MRQQHAVQPCRFAPVPSPMSVGGIRFGDRARARLDRLRVPVITPPNNIVSQRAVWKPHGRGVAGLLRMAHAHFLAR